MEKISLCDKWHYIEKMTDDFFNFQEDGTVVRLPHTSQEVPLHYMDEEVFDVTCGYSRILYISKEWEGKRLFLQFDGAAHVAEIYVNGKKIMTHYGGYTAFKVEITQDIKYGVDNRIVVKLDTSEKANVPPFGHVIDYMTYGGLYREVWLLIRETSFLEDIFVRTPHANQVLTDIKINRPESGNLIELNLFNSNRILIKQEVIVGTGEDILNYQLNVSDIKPWTPETPNLYTLQVFLKNKSEMIIDEQSVTFGFRQVDFRSDGFYLNEKKYKIRGVNRHQSYPHVGYAMPASMQIEDVRILKEELHVNAVRTSHYPQSQHFLDACDRLGLLVFTETPGWQHIKDDDQWKEIVCENVAEMIMQNRNHPSIILWGVRLNETQDNDELYKKTNKIAHELDASRQTSGVRFLLRSSLLEDVYAFNDFSHTGDNKGLLPKWLVSPSKKQAYLIAEFNGHMFPTKTVDNAAHRLSQAVRYANVLNEVYQRDEVSGAFGWCMFDYQTHGDFGSGDRICYHGVMDMYRNPKLAASVYASFSETDPVLEIGSDMHIGDYPAGAIGNNYIFTNADRVRLFKNEKLIKEFIPKNDSYKYLPHPPIAFKDTVGNVIELGEGYSYRKAEAIKDCLLAIQRYGTGLPLKYIGKFLWVMTRYMISPMKLYRLFFKYIENWGVSAPVYRFEGVKNNQVVSEVIKTSNAKLHLNAEVSHFDLIENETYDVASIRIQVQDENKNSASYAHLPIHIESTGEIEVIGPQTVTAEGGMCGTYIKTIGRAGKGKLKIYTDQTEAIQFDFTVVIESSDN